MDAFLGKWKLMPETTEGFEEYAEAVKIPEDLRQKLRSRTNVTAVMSQEGDAYTTVIDYGDSQETSTFKLGELQIEISDGYEIKNCYKLEGDKLNGEHDAMGEKGFSTRWVEGDKMTTVVEGNGKKMKVVYKRV